MEDSNKPVFKLFPEKLKAINENKCPICNNDINEAKFRDRLSLKEYGISGMCQACQDSVFGIK